MQRGERICFDAELPRETLLLAVLHDPGVASGLVLHGSIVAPRDGGDSRETGGKCGQAVLLLWRNESTLLWAGFGFAQIPAGTQRAARPLPHVRPGCHQAETLHQRRPG